MNGDDLDLNRPDDSVLTAPPDARAWCGGADVRDFLPLDYQTRMDRYALINDCMPHFFNLSRPVIAAM